MKAVWHSRSRRASRGLLPLLPVGYAKNTKGSIRAAPLRHPGSDGSPDDDVYQRAKASYQTMLRVDAHHPLTLARLGSLYGQGGAGSDTAGRSPRAALEAGNREVEVYNNLGIVLVT